MGNFMSASGDNTAPSKAHTSGLSIAALPEPAPPRQPAPEPEPEPEPDPPDPGPAEGQGFRDVAQSGHAVRVATRMKMCAMKLCRMAR